MKLIQRVGRKILYMYSVAVEREIQNSLASGLEGGKICYPCVVTHPELISIGKGSTILADSRLQLFPEATDKNGKIQMGDRCLVGYRFCILAGADVCIGNDCSIASNVCILSENHGINPSLDIPYGEQKLTTAPVKIGDGCWIGEKAIILPGVTIGKKSIIAAGTVVTKNIPAYSMAVGNPARVIKKYDFEKQEWERVRN